MKGHGMTDSTAVEIHKPCPDCGSSDALAVYDDGHSYCFSCSAWKKEEGDNVAYYEDYRPADLLLNKGGDVWEDRRISPAVADFYDLTVTNQAVVFSYHGVNGERGGKIRRAGKEFITEGEFQRCALYGYQTLKKAAKQRSKTIIITEGEADAMAAFQMANRIPDEATSISSSTRNTIVPVLSIKSGAKSAERDFKDHLELLEEFDRVFICFDNDPQGRDAADRCAKLINPGKAFVVELDHKDACEYTKRGLSEEFLAHLANTKAYTPSGIQNGADDYDRLWADQNIKSIPFPFDKLQDRTLGIRSREIVTWAAGTGVGKSSVLRELQHYYLKNTDNNIGIIALEESVDRTRRGIMAVEANDRLHLNEVFSKYSKQDIKKFFDVTLGTGRVYLYDHFGSMSTDDLMSRVRYMVQGLDCRIIFIDHLSILVSGMDISDERKAIDRTMTLLRKLTEETGCTLHLVTHLRRLNSDRSHEEGVEINLGHLRGSHGIAQISDTVIAMERDLQSDDPVVSNTTTLRVLKCRYTGDVGLAGKLFYDKTTGRMEPTEDTEEF